MHDSFRFHQPACGRATPITLLSRRKRRTTAPATAWTRPINVHRGAALCLGVFLSLACIGQPAAQAGSADSTTSGKAVGWSRSQRQPGQKGQSNSSATHGRLKWGQVNRALHVASEEPAAGEIQLMSLTEPADDPTADPFQDEVTEDENGEIADDEIVADDGSEFDPDEIAQSDTMQDPSELPDDLRLDTRSPSGLPELGEEFAQAGESEPERCPSPRDLKPINQITHRIAAEPGLFPQECALSDYPFQPRNFTPVTFVWKASALCHKPLYFQQPKLERYGHTFGPVLTPIISIGHFFVMIPCLPYNMGLEPPWECVYPLGWYRPGDCAPYTLGPLPLSLRGAASQGLITTGLWFLFP